MKDYKAVVICFGSPWCKEYPLLLEELSLVEKQLRTPVKFLSVDVKASPYIAEQYKIKELPAILIIKDRKVKRTLIGFQKREKIIEEIKKVL